MAENITNAVVPPIHPSAIMDSMQFGGTGPNYTWRKGGLATNPEDNHLWLITGGANDAIVPEQNALIEIDPDDKTIKFWGTTSLLDGLEFQDNSLSGSTLKDGSVTSDKLADGIQINGSALTLTNSRSINGVLFNGSSNVINYASCTTPAATTAKAVNVPNFKLITGATISVKFENAVSANNPTLNVTGSGNKPIFYHGNAIAANSLLAKTVYTFVYDGTNWNVVGDLTTTMTDNKTTQVVTNNDAQYPLVFASEANQADTVTSGVRFAPVFSTNPSTGKITAPTIVSKTSGSIPSINNQSSGSVINIENSGNIAGISSHKLRDGTIALVSGLNNGITVNYTRKSDVDANATEPTFQATLMDDAGNATFPNKVTARTFVGNINHATQADRDGQNRVIADTYLTKVDGDAKYVKNNITNSWVNPSVNTTTNDTQLFVRAKKGSFVANTLPAAGTDYSQSIAFMDGQNKTTMDSSIGYIEAYTESTGHSMMFAATNPANPEGDADAYVVIDYAKSGSNWVPSIELSHSPATKDSSMKIATTKYVQDNLKTLEVIDGGIL